jgi:hypothetical protein
MDKLHGEIMKHYTSLIAVNIVLYAGFCMAGAEIKIVPTTVGDNSIVNAIKKHSNITQAYVNRWKPFDVWIVGPSLRSGVMNVINDYIRVCKSFDLARIEFEDEKALMQSMPINWTIGALCAALKNLKDQGMYALALVAQIDDGSGMYKKYSYKILNDTITSYITIIDHNKNLLKESCDALIKKREEKQVEMVKLALDKVTINEKRAKSWSDRFGVVKVINELIDIKPHIDNPLLLMTLYLVNKTIFSDSFNRSEESE